MKIHPRSITRIGRVLCLLLAVLLCLSSCAGETYNPFTNDSNDAQKENDPRPKIAITFDDGPHNVRTRQIVDELNKYGYHATFFVVGNRVDGTDYNGKEAMQYAYSNGNEIGIHAYTHEVYYNSCSESEYQYEISATAAAIKAVEPDATIRLMRPVGGVISEERVEDSPYSVILWDIDSEDWRYKYKSGDSEEVAAEKVNTIVNNVMDNVHEGGIILLHDLYESTYDATVIILRRLYEEGYNVVSVSELLGSRAEAGVKYSSVR